MLGADGNAAVDIYSWTIRRMLSWTFLIPSWNLLRFWIWQRFCRRLIFAVACRMLMYYNSLSCHFLACHFLACHSLSCRYMHMYLLRFRAYPRLFGSQDSNPHIARLTQALDETRQQKFRYFFIEQLDSSHSHRKHLHVLCRLESTLTKKKSTHCFSIHSLST